LAKAGGDGVDGHAARKTVEEEATVEQQQKQISRLRRPFVIAGAVVGAALSGWYLYNNFGRVNPVPDPVWTKFVNIALLLFVPIYLANLVRRLVELVLRREKDQR
jgi:hypothetical protein